MTLTPEQDAALERLRRPARRGAFHVALVHGVTGSGKTELYVRLAARAMRAGRRVLVLVPEIALTPGVAAAFRARFGDRVAIQHSGLSDGERHDQWQRIRRGDVDVVVGTRSAVFAPLADIGLIVVDEEHDASYKQDESPRYNGRDVAVVRGRQQRRARRARIGDAVDGELRAREARAATSWSRSSGACSTGRWPRCAPSTCARSSRRSAPTQIVSRALGEAIAARLERREQVLVLLNRRGLLDVGVLPPVRRARWNARAARCRSSCTGGGGRSATTATTPGACRGPARRAAVRSSSCSATARSAWRRRSARLFPLARVARLDRDTARRRGAAAEMLARFGDGDLDVLVGTQMIAKGHDFPRDAGGRDLRRRRPGFGFDAAGLTKLTAEIEERRRKRNEIERDAQVAIQRKNLEAEQQLLELGREEEYARLAQEREIAVRRAQQNAEIAKESAARKQEAEQAQLAAQEAVDRARIAAERGGARRRVQMEQRVKELEIARSRAVEMAEIERRKQIELSEQQREVEIALESMKRSEAQAKAEAARATAVKAEEAVISARDVERAERERQVAMVAARRESEAKAVAALGGAETEKKAAVARADAITTHRRSRGHRRETQGRGRGDALPHRSGGPQGPERGREPAVGRVHAAARQARRHRAPRRHHTGERETAGTHRWYQDRAPGRPRHGHTLGWARRRRSDQPVRSGHEQRAQIQDPGAAGRIVAEGGRTDGARCGERCEGDAGTAVTRHLEMSRIGADDPS